MKKLIPLLAVLSLGGAAFGQSVSTPSFTPAAAPTPRTITGSVILSGTPTHGVPLTVIIPAASSGLQVAINGRLVGTTNNVGGFTITFPSAGTYKLDVEGYPMQTLVVN